MIAALAIGVALALAALGWVLRPLYRGAPRRSPDRRAPRGPALPAEDAVDALREVEFDLATGKLSDHDYAVLKERYTPRALEQLRAESARQSPADAESLIAQWRAAPADCPACGPRPESGAVFCSACGRYLPGGCGRCGRDVTESGASYCSGCGAGLAVA